MRGSHLCWSDAVLLSDLLDDRVLQHDPLRVLLAQLGRVAQRRVGLQHYPWSGEEGDAS